MSPSPKAIIRVTTAGKNFSRVNYNRRVYAIIRRYTPDVAEGEANECLADLTGLRTFFKMTYKELVGKILKDLETEIGVPFAVRVSSSSDYTKAKDASKKSKNISTYKEINSLFAGLSFATIKTRKSISLKKKKLTVPFLGKVS